MLTVEEIMKMSEEERHKLHPLKVHAASMVALAIKLDKIADNPNVGDFMRAATLLDRLNGLVRESAIRIAAKVLQAGGLGNSGEPIAKA